MFCWFTLEVNYATHCGIAQSLAGSLPWGGGNNETISTCCILKTGSCCLAPVVLQLEIICTVREGVQKPVSGSLPSNQFQQPQCLSLEMLPGLSKITLSTNASLYLCALLRSLPLPHLRWSEEMVGEMLEAVFRCGDCFSVQSCSPVDCHELPRPPLFFSWQAREAEFEAEQERIRREKEKEIARLRAMQEKAQDYRAEQVSTSSSSWLSLVPPTPVAIP